MVWKGTTEKQDLALVAAFQLAKARITQTWTVLSNDELFAKYTKLSKTATKTFLEEEGVRKRYEGLTKAVLNKLDTHGYTIDLRLNETVTEKGGFANTPFNWLNNPHGWIEIRPTFFGQQPMNQGEIISHELGRLINGMYLDGGIPTPDAKDFSKSQYNVEAWDSVIGSICGNLPPPEKKE